MYYIVLSVCPICLKLASCSQLCSLSGKFVDTINIFNRKINAVSMNISGFAKIFHEQIDEIL